jgi:hypothetical protein
MAVQGHQDRVLLAVTVETLVMAVMRIGNAAAVAAQAVVVAVVADSQTVALVLPHQSQAHQHFTAAAEVDRQQQGLELIGLRMAVLAEQVAGVGAIGLAETLAFHQPQEPLTQAAVAVIAAQVVRVL